MTSKTCTSLRTIVQEAFQSAVNRAYPNVTAEALITVANPKFGDYQCNSAMSLFKEHKQTLAVSNPKEIGEAIKSNMSSKMFDSIVVSPQGFVTVKISNNWIEDNLQGYLKGDLKKDCERKHIIVDFSSPNIAKEMHVGHLRSTIMGDTISRVLEFKGHQVDRVNHLGDWGTQFGMLIQYMKETHPDFLTNRPDLTKLCEFYKLSKQRFDESPEFKKNAQRQVVELQRGEEFATKAWKAFCEISLKDFDQIYDRLDIKLESRGESFYNDMIPPLVEDLTKKGLVVESLGAQCFFTETDPEKRKSETPLMIVKSDGGYGYDSTDMAAIYHRLILEKGDQLIYITDAGQESHFQKIFEAAKICGWYKPGTNTCTYAGFGVIQGEDGKKFKTRSGETVKLVSLLDEAVQRAQDEIRRRYDDGNMDPAGGSDFPPADVAAARIGYAAVKYFDLKQHRTTNYRFSYDKMLDSKGNTAVYMFYAYARICSIFRKSSVKATDLTTDDIKIETQEERALGLELLKFHDVLDEILEHIVPHKLAEYMYDISGLFTDFYQKCRVIGSEQERSRLALCEITRRILEKSLDLFGIVPLPRI